MAYAASNNGGDKGAASEPSGKSAGNYASGAGSAGVKGEPSGNTRGTRRAGSAASGDNEMKGRGGNPMNARMTTKGNGRRA